MNQGKKFFSGVSSNVSTKRKHPDTSTSAPKRTKSAAIEEKMSQAKEIVIKLCEKHGNKYSSEQFHAWSQLIQLGKQESYDDPPDYPFFKK